MDRETLVYVDLDGKPHLVGRLWARVRKNKESASFEYDKSWLDNPVHFSLEPALQVGPGAFYTPADTPMFGAIGDSAPDRWGRALMRRAERRRAESAGATPRTLQEIDFLLLVDDEARQGAGQERQVVPARNLLEDGEAAHAVAAELGLDMDVVHHLRREQEAVAEKVWIRFRVAGHVRLSQIG